MTDDTLNPLNNVITIDDDRIKNHGAAAALGSRQMRGKAQVRPHSAISWHLRLSSSTVDDVRAELVWRFERFRPDTNYIFRSSLTQSQDGVIAQNNFLICLSAQRPEPAGLSNVVLIVATVLIVQPEQSTEALHTDV